MQEMRLARLARFEASADGAAPAAHTAHTALATPAEADAPAGPNPRHAAPNAPAAVRPTVSLLGAVADGTAHLTADLTTWHDMPLGSHAREPSPTATAAAEGGWLMPSYRAEMAAAATAAIGPLAVAAFAPAPAGGTNLDRALGQGRAASPERLRILRSRRSNGGGAGSSRRPAPLVHAGDGVQGQLTAGPRLEALTAAPVVAEEDNDVVMLGRPALTPLLPASIVGAADRLTSRSRPGLAGLAFGETVTLLQPPLYPQ